MASKVNAKLRLVYTGIIDKDFQEDSYLCNTVENMKADPGNIYHNVRLLRKTHSAALVGLFVNDETYYLFENKL